MKMIKRPVQRMPRRKLRAAAARKSARYDEDEYFVEKPNVKLSRAFVVVLLLHVVAVGGIFAFSTLKDRQSSANTVRNQPATASPTSTPVANIAKGGAHPSSQNLVYQVKAGATLAGIAAQYGLSAHDLETANNLAPGTIVAIGRELVVPEHTNVKTGGELEKLLDSRQPDGPPRELALRMGNSIPFNAATTRHRSRRSSRLRHRSFYELTTLTTPRN